MNHFTEKRKPAALYVLGSLYPHVTGGMEIFNYYFLKRMLADRYHSIYYLGECKTDSDSGHFISFKKRWPVRLFYPFQFFLAVFKLRKIVSYAYLSNSKQSWIIPFCQSIVLQLFKIPYFVTIHWGKGPHWNFKYPFSYYFRHAKAVIGVSEPICHAFKKVIPDTDFIYIPPLIPFQQSLKAKQELKEQLGFNNQQKILLFAGTLKAMKNPDKIVEAFHKIGPAFLERHHILLLFAGKGDMETELKEKITHYALDKFIRTQGWVSREELPDYYKAADFYIISSDYEGTSISLLEAMVNRLSIIASDAPGINGMLIHEQNALLYNTESITHLAETLERIFLDQPLADRLADQAFIDFNNKYSYESMIEKYKAVFAEV